MKKFEFFIFYTHFAMLFLYTNGMGKSINTVGDKCIYIASVYEKYAREVYDYCMLAVLYLKQEVATKGRSRHSYILPVG